MKWILLLSPFFAANAFAVSVKECPAQIELRYTDFQVTSSLEKIFEELGGIEALEEEEMQAVRIAVDNVKRSDRIERKFALEKGKSGRCVYSSSDDIERAEIYTTRGQDMLWVQTNVGPRGILLRVYAKLDSVRKDKISLETESPGMALAIPRWPYENYRAGGPLVFIGRVKSLTVVP